MQRLYLAMIAAVLAAMVLCTCAGCEALDFAPPPASSAPASITAGDQPAVVVGSDVPATRASEAIEQARQGVAAIGPVIDTATGGASAPWITALGGLLAVGAYIERMLAAAKWKRYNATAEKIIQQAAAHTDDGQEPSAQVSAVLSPIAQKIENKPVVTL